VQGKLVTAQRYTMTNTPDAGKLFSQDVWYAEHGILAQTQVIVSQDGSVVAYQPM